jgi:hypothetical protein
VGDQFPPRIRKLVEKAMLGDNQAALDFMKWVAYRTLDKRKIKKIQKEREETITAKEKRLLKKLKKGLM